MRYTDDGVLFRCFEICQCFSSNSIALVKVIEDCLGRKAEKNLLPLQDGDVPDTYADAEDLRIDVGYKPDTTIEVGIRNFIDWYLEYYKIDLKQSA